MKAHLIPKDRGEFRRMAEGLYQYETSGAYYARFRLKGQRIMQRLGTNEHPCTSLPEAKRLLRDLRERLDRTDIAASKKTLSQIIREYRAIMPFTDSTKKYKDQYLDHLHKEFSLGKKISEIKKTDLLKFLAKFDDLAPATVNHIITVARDVFRYAIDDKVIAVSPMEGIKYKDLKSTTKRLIPSYAEFQSIVESIRSQKYADTAKESSDLIEFMGRAGLGQAECADLAWGDINFETDQIVIIRKKTSTEFTIPIYPQVRPLLERMNTERKAPSPSDPVFKIKNPKKALESACHRLNLPEYTARSFRRMFITRCLELGIDPQTIAEWQGHRDGGQLILKVYGRVTRKHQTKMAALLTDPTPD